MATPQKASRPGAFVISLDFELEWGMRDRKSVHGYRGHLLGSREVMPKMLELFAAYGIHATWATVGFLFFESRDELMASLPDHKPAYEDPRLSPYTALDEVGENERTDPLHYAPSLIARIRECPGQEIGSHTFSHYYCLESGQDLAAFRDDLRAAIGIAAKRGIPLRSLVFPRNQANSEYLPTCRELGFVAYRGNEDSAIYKPRTTHDQGLGLRALRLTDSYLPLSPSASFPVPGPANGRPVNLPSSRFLRSYSASLRLAEPLRFRRIAAQMTEAALSGRVYHLWWHPHNFGADQEENLAFCRKVLEHYCGLRDEHGMESVSMGELASA